MALFFAHSVLPFHFMQGGATGLDWPEMFLRESDSTARKKEANAPQGHSNGKRAREAMRIKKRPDRKWRNFKRASFTNHWQRRRRFCISQGVFGQLRTFLSSFASFLSSFTRVSLRDLSPFSAVSGGGIVRPSFSRAFSSILKWI